MRTLVIKTRIDQIWTSHNWVFDISYADIIDMEFISGSDHHLAIVMLNTSHIIRNFRAAACKRRDKPRTIFKYWEMKEEDWQSYRDTLDRKLIKDNSLNFHLNNDRCTQGVIDLI